MCRMRFSDGLGGGGSKNRTPSVIAAVFKNSPGVFFGECFYLPAVFNRAHKVG